jgi:hypoxanthine phosphoribosyltransferase
MVDLPRCRAVTWADVDGWADAIERKVRAADRLPETIVGLTRGGWVPARLLADRLQVHRIVSLRAQHWGITATPTGAATLTEGLSGPVRGERVLVVDDITDTGDSLRLAVERVEASKAARVESAAFLHIAHSKFAPTYFGEGIARDRWVWIVFPWNYWEDLATLARKAADETPGIEAVRTTLREKSGLDIPIRDLERVARLVPLDESVRRKSPSRP